MAVDHLLPHAPGLTAALDRGINLMQAHCGDASVLRGLARQFPRSRFAGTSPLSADVLRARQLARMDRLANAWFYQLLASDPALSAIYDAVLLADFSGSRLDGWTLAPLAAQLKRGGVLLVHLRGATAGDRRMLNTLLPACDLAPVCTAEPAFDPAGLVCVARR
jgi:hypothetical protein